MRYKRQIVTFLLGAAFLMFNTAHAAVIVNHMMTKDPKSNTSCETPVATPTFYSDEEAYCWVSVDNTVFADRVVFMWYGPDSVKYWEWANDFITSGPGCAWSPFDFQYDAPANLFGNWHVDVYYNQVLAFTENFTVVPKLPCPTEVLYENDSEETELLRYFRDNVLTKTPEGQELIKLYYELSPAIVKMMEEDEELRGELKEMIDGVLLLIRE